MKYCQINTKDFCGKLTLIETAILLKNTDFFIGNDSALGHIAAAVGIRTYSIFGKGNPKIYMPYGNKSYFYHNIKKNINNISTKLIFNRIKKILNKHEV
jgi:heptosyltransferase-3